jgi:hypothetical protein
MYVLYLYDGKEKGMRRTKYRPRKGQSKRWAVDKPRNTGVNREGMQALYGSSSSNRQPTVKEVGDVSVPSVFHEAPITKVTMLDIERAKQFTTIKRRDAVTGEVVSEDPIPPVIRTLAKLQEYKETPFLRTYKVAGEVYLIRTRNEVFFVNNNKKERTLTYSSESRALAAWQTSRCAGRWINIE